MVATAGPNTEEEAKKARRREVIRESVAKWRRNNPEKNKARQAIYWQRFRLRRMLDEMRFK